jgi:hypothetical protein
MYVCTIIHKEHGEGVFWEEELTVSKHYASPTSRSKGIDHRRPINLQGKSIGIILC